MKEIFISYRRSDSSNVTGRIFDHLTTRFGAERLFKDVDSIPLGKDYRTEIYNAVGQCKVLLAIIGNDWLNVVDQQGNLRIQNPDDYVHLEIAAALDRQVPVIPILVENTLMPTASDLPSPLKDLAFRNATSVRADPDFRPDIERLSKQLMDYLQVDPSHQSRSGKPIQARRIAVWSLGTLLAVGALLTAIVAVFALIDSNSAVSDKPEINVYYHKSLSQQAIAGAAGLRNSGYTVNLMIARHIEEPDDGISFRLALGNEISFPPKFSDRLPEIIQFFQGIPLSQVVYAPSEVPISKENVDLENTISIYLRGPEREAKAGGGGVQLNQSEPVSEEDGVPLGSVLESKRETTSPSPMPEKPELNGSTDGLDSKPSPAATGVPLRFELEGHEGPVTLMFTRDNQYLVSAGSIWRFSGDYNTSVKKGDSTLRLWNMKRSGEIKHLPAATLEITSLRVSPDGKAVAAAATDGTARIWTLPDGIESVVHREIGQEMTAIEFSPDSTKLALGTYNGVVRVFDWKSRKELAECRGHGGRIIRSGFLFSDDGSKLISAADDDSLRVWDVKTGTRLATIFKWDLDGIWAVFLTHDPNRIVVIDTRHGTRTIKLVDLAAQRVIQTSEARWIDDAFMAADGRTLYSIGSFGFQALDVVDMKAICEDREVTGSLFHILNGSDPRMFVVEDKRLTVYNFEGFAFDTIHIEQEHTTRIVSMEVSQDGGLVVTGDEAGSIKIWDAKLLSKP